MNEPELAQCHCIISHPTEPKFMVVNHGDHWLPPTVRFSAEGLLNSKAKLITDGIRRKYGLNVVLMRHIAEASKYHAVELELLNMNTSLNIEAVWVGRKEFEKFRVTTPGGLDPFDKWLTDAEQKSIPEFRRAWERKGWFNLASHWFQSELDARSIQTVGSVNQLTACRDESVLLDVKTSQGRMYFKACAPVRPNEVSLVMKLSAHFPDIVPEPVAVNEKSLWMITRDLKPARHLQIDGRDDNASLQALADIQLGSMDLRDELAAMGVSRMDGKVLSGFLQQFGQMHPILSTGPQALDTEELRRLHPIIQRLHQDSLKLAETPIPNLLTHADFHAHNVFPKEQGVWLWDWANAIISPPFFSLPIYTKWVDLDKQALAAYLERFEPFAEPAEVESARHLCARLHQTRHMFMLLKRLSVVEQFSNAATRAELGIRATARRILQENAH